MTKSLRLVFLLLFCCLGSVTPASADSALAPDLDTILDAPAMRGGVTGAVVLRVSDGQFLYTRNPDTRLLPASNLKLFTAAAALELLGDSFTYTTRVLATAKPSEQGEMRGNLLLKGVGDSALTTADLDDLAAQVVKAGITHVSGRVLADGTAFTDGPYGFGWEWDDFGDEEFAPISGLEVNDGDIAVRVTPGPNVGTPLSLLLDPLADGSELGMKIVNLATTAPEGAARDLRVTRPFGQSVLLVTGHLPMKSAPVTQNVPVSDPPQYVAAAFAASLRRHGVTIARLSTGITTPALLVVATHTSPPLAPYIALMNKPSDNLLAESLVRTLGIVKGRGGTFDAGHAVEMPFFQKIGVDTSALALVDGCGVSRRNFVTARAVGQLLLGMRRQADWQAYYDSLPIAGIDGTLKNRLKGTKAAGNVHAKTGTLSQVRALSGYLTGAHGDLYAFSLLMNNFPGTAHDAGEVQDRFVEHLANSL